MTRAGNCHTLPFDVRVLRPPSHCCTFFFFFFFFFLFGNVAPNASRMFVGLIPTLPLTVLGGNLRFKVF